LNPEVAYNSISISAETMSSVRNRLIADGFSGEDAQRIARNYVYHSRPGVGISGNGAFVRTISGGGGNPQYQPDISLSVSDVVVDTVRRGYARLTLTNATVNKKINTNGGIDPFPLIFKNSTLCGVYFEELIFPGVSANPCP
jgi:LDH2 family malate/lactate/ureidoglycolate dehydrogenase